MPPCTHKMLMLLVKFEHHGHPTLESEFLFSRALVALPP